MRGVTQTMGPIQREKLVRRIRNGTHRYECQQILQKIPQASAWSRTRTTRRCSALTAGASLFSTAYGASRRRSP